MPLLDHFHAPLLPLYPWESFHTLWTGLLVRYLNRLLPRRYLACAHTHFGAQVAADVAEVEQLDWQPAAGQGNGSRGEGGVAVETWSPPAVSMALTLVFPDDLEVRVIEDRGDTRLVGVIELVSPSNKDRPEARRGFAGKCAAYLQRGVGLVVVDIVTNRLANLHNELMALLEPSGAGRLPEGGSLYACAYRPVRRGQGAQADVWTFPLTLGEALPKVPLALLGGGVVPLELEPTYHEACVDSRI